MIKSLKDGQYQYSESDFLGEGSFAKVYKGIITKTQRVIAVRILSLKLIKQYGNKIKSIISTRIITAGGQVAVLKELSESNDVGAIFTTRIFDCFLTEHNVTMILEFCPDGSLEDVVSKRGPISESEGLEIMYQLALGLQFIAKKKVVHRDIKPDNVFLKKEGNNMLYKLGDFGFAVKKQINDEIVGTPIFMSPQLFREQKYGSQVDVWAFGLMVHYVLFKEHYFLESSQAKVKARVLSTQYSLSNIQKASISAKTADLLLLCLQMDKNKRIKAEDVCRHPSFDSIRPKIQIMIKQVQSINQVTESKFRKDTVKGRLISHLMSFNFIFDLAILLRKKDAYNLATLYLLKYNLGELSILAGRLNNKQNVLNHPGWGEFINTQEFKRSLGILDGLLATHLKVFEEVYNVIMQTFASNMGPEVAQGICNNLGGGPYAKMNPAIAVYQMKNNWIPRLSNSPEDYVIKLQIIIVTALLQNASIDFDFYELEVTKRQISIPERIDKLKKGLKMN